MTNRSLPTTLATLALVLSGFCLSSCGPKEYPLRTCVVCDHSLGEQGGPVIFVYEKQKVKVCGEEHHAEFLKDPRRYLAKIMESKIL